MRSAVTVIEVGPATIRGGRSVDEDLAAEAIDCLDDDVMLVEDRPTPLSEVWHGLLQRAADGRPATFVVPSVWRGRRVDFVSAVAHRVCPGAAVVFRSQALADSAGPAPSVVEIADDLVVVATDRVTALPRSSDDPEDALVDAVVRHVGRRGPVLVDAPPGVTAANALAAAIITGLRADGAAASVADPRAVRRGVPQRVVTGRARPRRVAVLAGAVCAAATAVAAGVAGEGEPARENPSALAVEGRVAVSLPEAWPVRRIVKGPGSARLQADSPDADRLALHVTQSPLPYRQSPEQIAATLRAALDAEPVGVFTDFRADAERAGRRAVTYREHRGDVDVDWFVFTDDLLRIGVGCQSPRDGAELIRAVCDVAVRSARAVT